MRRKREEMLHYRIEGFQRMKHFDNCQVRVVSDLILLSVNLRDSCVPKVGLHMKHD